jgi:predicted nucleotidyltransferase
MMDLESLKRQKSAIVRVAERHGAQNVRVFGSVATGESSSHSDIDFLVDLEPGRNLFDLGGLRADLRDLLDAEIDVLEARCIHPYVRDRILKEAVPL